MNETIERILPIIAFFSIGLSCNKLNWISNEGMANIKKLVINFALPSVLYLTFLKMEFQSEYFILIFLIIIMLILMLIFGRIVNFLPAFKNKYNPFMTSGYSFGLVGVSLFSIMYGVENMIIFSIIGLAHEMFVWTIYFGYLKITVHNNGIDLKEIIKLFTTPVMFGIGFGLLGNFLGFSQIFSHNGVWLGFLATVQYLSDASIPLILLSIGYNINLSAKNMYATGKLVFLKFIVIFLVALPFKYLVIDKFIEPNFWLDVSFVAFLLLPPVFSFPLFISTTATEEDLEVISSAVAIYTFLSVLAFIIYAIFVTV